ncbi:hypothetical protein DEU56DRAFT_825476 [Suillus clintonianus]|uniref:uncharacterized protein n=1 Tax=Suillus clintonianus TaxID=1904413 RepID=UPI001B874E99|nr:uncharacterized protein DEU56DRAFT_825476 [Suillus clintonianus]KAG2125406.1 hypothetical protein DEU56DRAFT_825476 [Suillus clintonianus]
MAVGLLSLPIELICHILLILTPGDLCHCITTCKIVWDAAQNSVHIQYKLELYAQGFNETGATTPDSIGVSTKMCSLKRLGSSWRSDFHTNTVFEDRVVCSDELQLQGIQSAKCGIWWMARWEREWEQANLRVLIRECKANTTHSNITLRGLVSQHHHWRPRSIVIDPLQNLVVAISSAARIDMPNTELALHAFTVDVWLASSQLPHPDSARTSFECMHTCDAYSSYSVYFVGMPAVCGDHVVILYYVVNLDFRVDGTDAASNMFIQVIAWRKGHIKRYPLCERGGQGVTFHLVDERTVVVVSEGRMTVYTLQGPGDSIQRRIAYLLPNLKPGFGPSRRASPYYVAYATPSFHSAVAHPGLMPSYVPSPESQIMVLEILPRSWPVIMVIDMAVFSEKAARSENPVEVPWADWGPKYTWCFPHHPSHRISVFGSKMAYALPRDRTPEPGQRVEALSSDHFYVHIWDFNKRFIARSQNTHDPDSPDVVICKPGRFPQSCFDEDLTSNHPYTASVCPEPFSMHRFDRFFLEQDRLTLIWLSAIVVDIRVISPVPMEVLLDPEMH